MGAEVGVVLLKQREVRAAAGDAVARHVEGVVRAACTPDIAGRGGIVARYLPAIFLYPLAC